MTGKSIAPSRENREAAPSPDGADASPQPDMKRRLRRAPIAVVVLATIAPILGSGCSQLSGKDFPEPIQKLFEPDTRREYVFYRPSGYDRASAWPLIVLCHGGLGDSPTAQVEAWAQLAERNGLIVAAPALESPSVMNWRKADAQAALLRADEQAILGVVRHVRAGNHISEDRVMIHGWAGGALPALYAGLAHPEVFRAVSVFQPRFDASYFADIRAGLDPYLPIGVFFVGSDIMVGGQARELVNWLRGANVDVTSDPVGSVTASEGQHAVAFFENVLRTRPWIRIERLPSAGGNPLEVRLRARTTVKPHKLVWRFGDGDEAIVDEPIHVYTSAGVFRVSLSLEVTGGATHERHIDLRVP